jgi:Na+/melibiose symporter-like transporter
MPERLQKLSFVEKAGYSLGDCAANFVFQALIIFQLQFYTDTFGLAAAVAGTLLLVGRLWDAFFDPMMGAIADRTNTRWGKFRPWVLWTAVPWGVVMFLAYTTPHFGGTGKLIYACVTNVLLMTLYSANNTPYSALTGVMTGDVNERTSLSTYRFVAALFAGLLVGGFTLPLVAKFGHGDSAKGWQMTMGLWAIVCVVFFLITFATVRERIQPDPRQKSSAKRDFGDLLKNGPWIAMFLFTLVHLMAVAMRGGTMAYYFKYNVNQDRLFAFLKSWGLTAPADGSNPGGVWHSLLNTFGLIIDPQRTNVSQVGFSLLNMSSQFVTIVGIMCATWLAIRFGKKAVVIAGFAGALIFMALFMVVRTDAIWTIFAVDWARAVCYAPTIPLVWAMFADVVDYSEWITGRRATGLIFAAIVFGLKAGLSLGGAIAGWLLSAFGYQANVQQTDHALWGIRLIVSVIPAGLFLVCLICVVCYKITKKMNLQIQDELAERRKQYAALPAASGVS